MLFTVTQRNGTYFPGPVGVGVECYWKQHVGLYEMKARQDFLD